jgi:hypothetical protein
VSGGDDDGFDLRLADVSHERGEADHRACVLGHPYALGADRREVLVEALAAVVGTERGVGEELAVPLRELVPQRSAGAQVVRLVRTDDNRHGTSRLGAGSDDGRGRHGM